MSKVADYIDNSKEGSRSTQKIVDILKESKVLTQFQGKPELFATQEQLKELRLVNQRYPGVLGFAFETVQKYGPETGQPTNIYNVTINTAVLNAASEVKAQDSEFNFKNNFEKDEFTRKTQAKSEGVTKEEESTETELSANTYTTKENAQKELMELAINAKVIIESEIRDVQNLPDDQIERKENRLRRLKIAVANINKVEDFFMFVAANKDNVNNAIAEFNSLMALSVEERATAPNMNRMYEIKQTLDSLDTIQKLEQVALDQLALGNVVSKDRFRIMLTDIKETIDKAKRLDKQFEQEIIPVMAEVLVGFHNEAIDPKIQEIINNIEQTGDWRRFSTQIRQTNEYKDLKANRDKGVITEEEFQAQAKALTLEQFKNRQIPGRDKLIRDLKQAHRDKSGFSYLFDPIIYSSEPAIQLFAKSVKEATFKKNEMTLDFKYDLAREYDLFSEGMSESDIAGLNDSLLETTLVPQYDNEGNEIDPIEVLSLVNPILVDKFRQDETAMYKKLNKKYKKPQRADYKDEASFDQALTDWNKTANKTRYYNEVAAWHKENTEPIPTYKEELAKINRQITKAKKDKAEANKIGRADLEADADTQLAKLIQKRNFNINPITGQPRGSFIKPKASKYTNPKYTAIQNDAKKKRYYDFIVKEFVKGQKMIGSKRMTKNSWEDFSYIMPSVRKNEFDRVYEEGAIETVKDIFKEGFTPQNTDIIFGNYNEKTGELEKSVPVYYTNNIPAKDVSKDIASSIYAFRDMAHNKQTKDEIVGQVMLFRDIIKNRDTLKVNPAGVAYLSSVANKLGIKLPAKKPGESYTYKHVDTFIDTIMFGQRELKENFNLFGKEFSANKIANNINAFTAINTLSFNFLQGANQSIIDNMALISEANAGQFFSRGDLAWAKSRYWAEGAGLSDTGKFIPDTKLGKTLEMFDALTEFTDQEGNRLVGSKLRKALQSGNLLVVQQAAEHEVAATRMLALMKNLEGKLKDKDGNVINNKDGSPANLYDLLIVDTKTGKLSIDPRVDNFSKSDFINLMQGLSRRTNQTKGSFDRATAQRVWYGKLAMLFRSWLLPGLRRRYGHGGFTGPTVHADEELGTVTQGMYISFWNFLSKSVSEKAWPHTVFGQLTEMEQQNVKRTATELGSLAAAFAIIAALQELDDDEETFASNFLLYQALRYQAEIKQWTPLYGTSEALRIAKSPTATARQIEQTLKLFRQIKREGLYNLGFPVDETDIFYQRNTGRYKKGDRKIQKYVEDLMPVVRGLSKSGNAKDAAQYFLGGTYN
jgi:hypothetical protein